MRTHIYLPGALVLLLAVATGQQAPQATQSNSKQGKQSTVQQPPPAQDPAPLFGGQIGVRSSKSTKESATLGFNGIDPSGKVEKKMLGATPRPQDVAKVERMDDAHPSRAEFTAFVKEGGLKTK